MNKKRTIQLGESICCPHLKISNVKDTKEYKQPTCDLINRYITNKKVRMCCLEQFGQCGVLRK